MIFFTFLFTEVKTIRAIAKESRKIFNESIKYYDISNQNELIKKNEHIIQLIKKNSDEVQTNLSSFKELTYENRYFNFFKRK